MLSNNWMKLLVFAYELIKMKWNKQCSFLVVPARVQCPTTTPGYWLLLWSTQSPSGGGFLQKCISERNQGLGAYAGQILRKERKAGYVQVRAPDPGTLVSLWAALEISSEIPHELIQILPRCSAAVSSPQGLLLCGMCKLAVWAQCGVWVPEGFEVRGRIYTLWSVSLLQEAVAHEGTVWIYGINPAFFGSSSGYLYAQTCSSVSEIHVRGVQGTLSTCVWLLRVHLGSDALPVSASSLRPENVHRFPRVTM